MASDESPAYNLIDISIKRLVRDNPAAFLQLAGFTIISAHITFEDIAIQQRELRADHVCILTDENGVMRGVVYMEYQSIPDAAIIKDWLSKWTSLLQRFPVPVVLLVVYMQKGHYATFHQEYRAQLDGLETAVQFNTFRFWECAAQIRSGKYPDFVPLLTLCEDQPTEATVREQVALIQSSTLEEARKQELLSLSFLVASRDISRSILLHIIQETFAMKTLPSIVEDIWGDLLRERENERVREAEKLAEQRGEKRGEEIGEKRGEERGEKRGEKRGEEIGKEIGEALGALKDARTIVLRMYTKRLGAPSAAVVAHLEAIENIETLHAIIDRYDEQVESWEQLLQSGGAE